MAETSLTVGPATPASTAPQSTITELVSGILDDAQRLAKQQFDMLKSEFHEDLRKTKQATFLGGLGVAALTVGGVSLVFAIVHTLDRFVPGLPLWGAWMIFAAIFLAAGTVLALVARNLFESFNPLPDKTLTALQENLTWKTSPQT